MVSGFTFFAIRSKPLYNAPTVIPCVTLESSFSEEVATEVSRYEDRLIGHPVAQMIEKIQSLLQNSEPPEEAEGLEELERLRSVAHYIEDTIAQSDPELIAANALDPLPAYLEPTIASVTAYNEDSNRQHLVAANDQMDKALEIVHARLPTLPPDSSLANARETVVSFRRSVGQYTRNIEEAASDLENTLEALATKTVFG